VAEGILVRLCRGALQPTVSGERLKREVIPILLALRRVAAYMAFKADSATTGQIFKSFKSWHCHFPKGKALQGIDSGSEVSRGSIKESEEMAISSLSLLFDGSADSILLKQLASDPNASAEALIQLPGLATRLPGAGAGVKIFVDCKIEKLPDRFRRVDKVRLADVLAVEDVKEALYTKQSLLVRLYGLRLADADWVHSNASSGQCLAFEPALLFHLYLWLTPQFVATYGEVAKVLLREAARHSNSSSKKLAVAQGTLPEKLQKPRLSYQICADTDSESTKDTAARCLDFEGLFRRLSFFGEHKG
jgi:hypothetical protein